MPEATIPRVSDAIDNLPTREGYDRWAAIYDAEENPLVLLEEPVFERLCGPVAGLDLLDVGCGTGRHSLALARRGARVVAIDFSPAMLARARAKPGAERVAFREHDLRHPMPFEDARFALAASALVLDHVADLDQAFTELRRVASRAVVVTVMHPALMLRGVQARFTDPATGRETRPESRPNRICDYVAAAVRAGLAIEAIEEHAVGAELASRSPRAAKYLGWPLLFAMRLRANPPSAGCPAPGAVS